MKSNHRKFFVLLFIVASFYASSQETQDTRSLLTILEEVSDRYGYSFNYALSTIDNIRLAPPESQWTLKETIQYLTEKTGLVFTMLPNKFIAIKKGNRLLCGYLKDKDTQNSLPYATINGSTTSTVSDENGYFELTVNGGAEEITIRYLGYKDLKRQAGYFPTGNCTDIYLIPQQQQLPEIVLYDYLVRGIDQLDDGSYRIDFSRFSILPGLTETDVLQSVQA